jgi:hypothetical protein
VQISIKVHETFPELFRGGMRIFDI